ncbi:MAG: hypothetical protein ACK5L3_02020 [Oscillospiraceae bacterium]
MAEQNHDYEQYNPQAGGKLFTSSMFGFNKEEVLEYLEELADENYQRQEADERRIQELTQRIKTLEKQSSSQAGGFFSAEAQQAQQANEALNHQLQEQGARLNQALQDLEIAKEATSQSADELQELRDQLYNAQQENAWLRQEFQKYEQAYAQVAQQLQQATQGQWVQGMPTAEEMQQLEQQLQQALAEAQKAKEQLAAQQQTAQEAQGLKEQLATQQQAAGQLQQALLEAQNLRLQLTQLQQAGQQQTALQQLQEERETLQKQLEESGKTGEEENIANARQAATAIIAEANAEANRIRDNAIAERERIHRQMKASAGGISESIYNLRTEISGVEGNVSNSLEAVQHTLNKVANALAYTEQSLSTFGLQIDRFPSSAPSVQRPQPFFQAERQQEGSMPVGYSAPAQERRAARPEPTVVQGGGNARSFRATYSSSPTAASNWPQTAEAYRYDEEESKDARLRDLSDSLVDTLRQMMN